MPFDALTAVRAIHVIFASLWVGAAFFMAFVLGPSFRAAGPAAGPLMMTVMRRGGLSRYFLTLGLVTLLAGGYLYYRLGYVDAPFRDGPSAVLTIGVLLATGALLHGVFSLLPNENRMKALVHSMPAQGPPPPEAIAKMQEFGMKQGKESGISAAILALALLAMTLHGLF